MEQRSPYLYSSSGVYITHSRSGWQSFTLFLLLLIFLIIGLHLMVYQFISGNRWHTNQGMLNPYYNQPVYLQRSITERQQRIFFLHKALVVRKSQPGQVVQGAWGKNLACTSHWENALAGIPMFNVSFKYFHSAEHRQPGIHLGLLKNVLPWQTTAKRKQLFV